MFLTIRKDVQSNSVVVARNVFPHGGLKHACGLLQNVKMTRSIMMNGDEVFVRAGLLGGTSL